MPITALPKATVQLLGSGQVLGSPSALVKELIDNALDAKATSIDIVISKNTLDKLEVRDNGHGILSEDFDSLGKHGHTSKLRTFEELKFVGGTSLGFRGEALASAVHLGEVSLKTKTEGSTVATKLLFKAPRGVDQKSPTSHPVGTTVSVSKFMDRIPVRKKTFEKEASKTLAKINQLLRSYALARPSVRFSLKIKEGGKGSWSFAPRPHDGIKEAVSLVIGRDAAMECIEKSMMSAKHQAKAVALLSESQHTNSCDIEDGTFVIEAFIPKPDANPSKIGTGQYLSIDSRPVSHEKGTMKKVVTLFKKYICGALSDSFDKVKNPFIRLNIKCPIASYDANVEPSKDDVLFGNEQVVLELVEDLLKEVYGELMHIPGPTSSKSRVTECDNFNLLLAREHDVAKNLSKEDSGDAVLTTETSTAAQKTTLLPQMPPSSSPTPRTSLSLTMEALTARENPITEIEDTLEKQSGNGGRKWGFSMSKDFSEEIDDERQCGRASNTFSPHPPQTPDREVSGTPLNPWVIAKMTAPATRNGATFEANPLTNCPVSKIVSEAPLHSEPSDDSNMFAPPNKRPCQTFYIDDVQTLRPSASRRYSASSIYPRSYEEQFADKVPPNQRRRRNDFVSARNIPEDTLVSPPPTAPKLPSRSGGPNRPSVLPLKTVENRIAPTDRFVQTTLLGNSPQRRRRSDGGQEIRLQNEPDQDLAWAMDFEQRKENATRLRREEIRAEEMKAGYRKSSRPVRSSPHKNRYNAAIASLEADQLQVNASNAIVERKLPFKTTLPDGDSRAYLMKRQKSFAAQEKGIEISPAIMRAKSTRLPLETIPPKQRLYDLIYNMSTDMEKLQRSMQVLVEEDMYVRCGDQNSGLNNRTEESSLLEGKLQDIVNLWIGSGEERKYEVEYNFGSWLDFRSLAT